MATSGVLVDETEDDLDGDLDLTQSTDWDKVKKDATCPGCDQFYKNPKLLTCCHIYCLRCIEEQFRAQEGATSLYFDCVVCQYRILLKDVTKIDDLLDHKSSEYLGIVYRVRCRAKEETPTCNNCDIAATAACCQCGIFMCETCSNDHLSTRNREYHCVLSVDDLRNDRIPNPYKQEHEPPFCRYHSYKQISLYCHDCFEFICDDCTSDVHEGHYVESIPEAAKKERETLQANIEKLQEMKEVTDQRKAALEHERQQLKITEKQELHRLQAAFDLVYKMLEEQRQKALDKVHKAADEAYAVLDEEQQQLLLLMEQIQSGTVPLD